MPLAPSSMPSASGASASPVAAPSASVSVLAPAASSSASAPSRGDGCWSALPSSLGAAGQEDKLLDELRVRCARDFRPLGDVKSIEPGGVARFEVPARTCARALMAGTALEASSLARDVSTASRKAQLRLAEGGGSHDAVLPPHGPFCTAKASFFEVTNRSAKPAKLLVVVGPPG